MGTMPNPDLMDDEDMSDDIPEADTDTDAEDKAASPDVAPSAPIKRSDLSGYNDGVYRTLSDPLAQSSTYSSLPDALKQHMAKYAQAQDQQKRQALGTGLSAALVQLGHGLSGAKGNADLSGVKAVAQAEGDPMKNLQNEQAEALKAAQMQKILAGSDPNSPLAKALAQSYGPMIQKAGFNVPDGLSPDQIQTLGKQADFVNKNNDTKAYRDAMIANAQTKTAALQGQKAAAAQDKADQQQSKAYTQLRKDLETFRGNRPVAQAAMDAYSADKALALVKDKDPDSLTTQDLSLLANEMGKIASGGVPGEHGVQALMPSNLRTKYAELTAFLTSKPTDAEAGAYVRKNMSYLKDMTAEANKSVDAYRKNILKGYKNRVASSDYDEAVSDYKLGDQPASPAPSAPQPTKVVNGVSYQKVDGGWKRVSNGQ